jgi:predicted transposase YbfD/YdcC
MPSPSASQPFAPVLESRTDPRVDRSERHSLPELITPAVWATRGNADGWADIERFGRAQRDSFRTFLGLPSGIPSHDTVGRVFARLDPAALMAGLQQWPGALGTAVAGEVVAIDGKAPRGSFDRAAGKSPLRLVSAWAPEARLAPGQAAVDAKPNEITAIPRLLGLLDLKGVVVTIGAMGCQKGIAAAIRARGAGHVLAVEESPPGLCQAIHEAFLAHAAGDFSDPPLRRVQTVGRGHGRDETREHFIAEVPEALAWSGQWPAARAIGMVSRTRVADGGESDELAYSLSGRPPRVEALARAVRGHWGIGNRLHWGLEAIFAEDKSRARKGHSPVSLGMLRRLVLSILRKDTPVKGGLRGKRLRAGWDDEVLLKILTGVSRD